MRPSLAASRWTDRLAWALFVLALGGAFVAGRAFSSLGFRLWGIPIPLAEMLLGLLVLYGWFVLRIRPRPLLPFVLAAAFLAIATIRLFADYGNFREDALRDYTIALEIGYLYVGYWVLRHFGVDRLIRVLTWVFLLAFASFWFHLLGGTWADTLGPLVGFRNQVHLFGEEMVGPAACAGLFFFLWLRPIGWPSYVISALFAPLILLAELRSLYVGVPFVLAFTVIAAWPRLESWGRRGIVVALALMILSFGVLVILAPQGRLERFSPTFFFSHVATLAGEEGPGAGSLRQRIDWFESAIETLNERPVRWLIGVGVGPDLADGFVDLNSRLVRKPHNDFLEVMTRFGLPALLLFLGALLIPLGAAIKAARTHLADAAMRFMWWLIATVLIYLIVAVTQPLLSYPYATVPVYTLLGVGFALAQRHDIERKSRDGTEDRDRPVAEAERVE